MSRKTPPPGWTKVLISCGFQASEEVAAFLAELTEGGTETKDGAVGEAPLIVAGYLPRGSEEDGLRKIEKFLGAGARLLGVEEVTDEDWNENWKRHFDVSRLTDRLTVRPSWKEYDPQAGELVITIDPAMAFGTGLHESTHLVLDFIEEMYVTGAAGPRRVLDVGTGTGILAMACALVGAETVRAIDNDPLAVEAARKNVERNGLAGRVTVSGEGLGAVAGTWDLIVANIVHDVLVTLAGEFARRLSAGGSLVCAGILAGHQEKSLARALEGHGLAVTASKREGEWAALQVKLFS